MKYLILLPTLLLSVWLFYQQSSLLAAPGAATTPTPTPAEEATGALITTTTTVTEANAAPTLADLQAQIAALQAQVDELTVAHAATHAADLNQVTTAVYLLDTAGLHDLDVRLNKEQVIAPGDAGRVARVGRLLAAVAWPTPLATEIVTLTTALADLATALEDDDLATAAPLATLVHDVQHDFSHAVDHWAAEAAAPAHSAGQAFRVTSAVYLLDTAGLHDLDVRLNKEQVIAPGDAGGVARVARLLDTVDWPAPLATAVVTLTTVLTDLATALENDDLATAAPLATQVHEVQHDFSHAAEHWLGEMSGHHDEGADHAEGGEKPADGHK
ncbi:MAG: hypothetical protein DYG89_41705 [Caldilinea sp. CFX5]|nr:hypothetical protein [Caldilinea sp. CFX5]